MKAESIKEGQRVIAMQPLDGIPVGTEGVIVRLAAGEVMVAWDFPERPLPNRQPCCIADMRYTDSWAPYRTLFQERFALQALLEANASGLPSTKPSPTIRSTPV